MAIFCSCRASSDTKLIQFLGRNGQPVRLKEALYACSKTPTHSCTNIDDCIGQIAEHVNAHNSLFPDNTIQIYPVRGKPSPDR